MKLSCPFCARFLASAFTRLALGIMVSLAAASAAHAANKTWTNAVSGNFATNGVWTQPGAPGATDVATFSAAGTYTVTFNNSPNPLPNPVLNQDLFFSTGNVTFTSGTGGPFTYQLTGSGGDDANLTGGTLTLGSGGSPLNMTIDDDLVVRGGATLNVKSGSVVNTLDLVLANTGVGGGTIVVDGTASALNVSDNTTQSLGLNGSLATLTFQNFSTGSFSGPLDVGVSSSGALNVQSGAHPNIGNLSVGSGTSTGSVNINGGSTLVQSGAATLTVGAASAGIGTINIGTTTTGGTLTTGSGLFTINNTGTVNIGSATTAGTLNANGNLAINGGALTLAGGSTLNASGGISIGTIAGSSATVAIKGTGSSLVQSGASTLTVGAASGGNVALDIGTNGPGTLTTGTGLFTINKTGAVSLGNFNISANTGTFNANGDVTIDGGALFVNNSGSKFLLAAGKTFTVQNGGLVAGVNATTTTAANAIYNITGANSRWESPLTIGNGAQVNVSSGGSLTVPSLGGIVTLNGNGTLSYQGIGGLIAELELYVQNHFTLNIGTTISGSVLVANSSNLYPGRFIIDGTSTVNIGSATTTGNFGMYGRVIVDGGVLQVLNSGSSFTFAPVDDSQSISIANGGRVTFGFNFDMGIQNNLGTNITGTNSKWELVDGSGLTIYGSSQVTIDNGGTLTAGFISVEVGHGRLNFNNGTVGITGAAGLTLGPTNLGTNFSVDLNHNLNVTNTTTIPVGESLTVDDGTFNTGSLVVNGDFNFIRGTLGITGPAGLTVGAGGSFGATAVFNANQILNVTNTLTVNAGAFLDVAGGFSAGNLVNNGDLVVVNSAVDGPVVNNQAVTVVGVVNFNGLVSGPGGFFGPGTAHFNGGLAPGASPADVSFEGSLALADTNTLFIEIGGNTPGSQYDRLTIAGSASLDGILNVSLINLMNGFTLIGGQQFTILTAGSIVNNGFVLTGSAANLFNLFVSSTSVILQAIGLAGDYNHNGIVDAADYTVWRDSLGRTGSGLAADGDNSGASAGVIDQADYTVWKTNFGNHVSGAGAAGSATASAAVPEPAGVLLMWLGMIGLLAMYRQSARHISLQYLIG